MLRVFSKKAFELKNRETGEKVTTLVMDFCNLPDWVIHDPMYQWAIRDSDLQVIPQEAKAVVPKKPVKKSNLTGEVKDDDQEPEDNEKKDLEAGDGNGAQ